MIAAILIASLGFFAITAQTLLFRDFLLAFEGNELAIGGFFTSWFLWIAAGAWLARRAKIGRRLFPALTLLYIPAFITEHMLILHARSIIGIAGYELFPLGAMLVLSILTNASVSGITGGLFALACGWWDQRAENGSAPALPVTYIYLLETLGATVGGIVVTVGLTWQVPAMTLFLAAAFVLCLSAAWAADRPKWRILPMVLFIPLFGLHAGQHWAEWDAQYTWTRIFPVEDYRDRFVTAQTEYLLGESSGQWTVLSSGSVSDTFPTPEHGAEIAAISLAQHPRARKILLVGNGGVSIALQFNRLPQIESFTALHPDPEYFFHLLPKVPEDLRNRLILFNHPDTDVRNYLSQAKEKFDLVLINLPPPLTLSANRYFTQEFFQQVKCALAKDGVIAVRITGGANYLSGEGARLGASVFNTLCSIFPYRALKPGEESWIFASDSDIVSESPAILRDRFAALPGAAAAYPPDALPGLYLPDRIAFQREAYQRIQDPDHLNVFINRDDHPKAMLFGLLFALRQAGFKNVAARFPYDSQVLLWCLLDGLFLYAFLRIIYLLRLPKSPPGFQMVSRFDTDVQVCVTGIIGIASSIAILFSFQSQFGSLYLYIGLTSALFMAGACAGSLLAERVLRRRTNAAQGALLIIAVPHMIVLAGIAWTMNGAPFWAYASMFPLCGLFTGAYFPWAEIQHRASGRAALPSGAELESVDHIGAAAGSALFGLILLPVFGSALSVAMLILLIPAVILPAYLHPRRLFAADRFDRICGPLGYVLIGLCLILLSASGFIAAHNRHANDQQFTETVKAMAKNLQLTKREMVLPEGPRIEYWVASPRDQNSPIYFFNSGSFCSIPGYGGPVHCVLAVNDKGVLTDLRILDSNETPSYLAMLDGWLDRLKGQDLSPSDALESIDAVSGATITSHAVWQTVQVAGRKFSVQVLGKTGSAIPAQPSKRLDNNVILLSFFLLAAIFLHARPHPKLRHAFLFASFILLGVWSNLQFSTHHVFTLVTGALPLRWTTSFFLVVLVPAYVALFGNIYCGYVCPFGALQELVEYLRPASMATDPPKVLWRSTRTLKYVLLILMAVLFALTRDFNILSVDPLTNIFSAARERIVLVCAGFLVLLAIPYRRFFCRNLCPAGAFLAIIGSLHLLRFFGEKPIPSQCNLGVRSTRDMDCIRCDRCLHAKK